MLSIVAGKKKKAKAKTTTEKEMRGFHESGGKRLTCQEADQGETETNKNCKRNRKACERLEEILICKRRSMSGPRLQENKEQTRIAKGQETMAMIASKPRT